MQVNRHQLQTAAGHCSLVITLGETRVSCSLYRNDDFEVFFELEKEGASEDFFKAVCAEVEKRYWRCNPVPYPETILTWVEAFFE